MTNNIKYYWIKQSNKKTDNLRLDKKSKTYAIYRRHTLDSMILSFKWND